MQLFVSVVVLRSLEMLGVRCLIVVAAGIGCATTDPAALYKRGVSAFENDEMQPAADALDLFTAKACGPGSSNGRCREAYIKLGHARERLGSPGAAWAAYDAALGFGPHTRDAAVQADLARVQQALKDKHGQASDRSPVIVRYRDEVGDEYSARSVLISLDFDPVLVKDKNASELHSADFAKVFGGSVAAGEHVIVVETVHDCRPGGGVQCARAKVRKAWPFRSAAHTPTTVEIRAYGEDGPSGGASRPTIELTTH
jgi:hypothetical protein